MQSTWYRRPEDMGPADVQRAGRGRGRGRPPHQPRAASVHAVPHHMFAMGQHASYASNPYYYNPLRMEAMLPHWQYAQQSSHRDSHQISSRAIPGYAGFTTRRKTRVSPSRHGQYEAVNREQQFNEFNELNNTDQTYASYHTHASRGGFLQPPRFQRSSFTHPAYAHNGGQTRIQDKAPQSRANQRTGQKARKPQERGFAVLKEITRESSTTSYMNITRPQTPQDQENGDVSHLILKHSKADYLEKLTPKLTPPTNKTLDETAAFLNHPQLMLQKANMASTNDIGHSKHTSGETLSHKPMMEGHSGITSITQYPPQAHQTHAEKIHSAQVPRSHEQLQALRRRGPTYAIHDDLTTSQIPDFRKYSELSVTVQPPPAHQASMAKKDNLPKYPDLHTPPLGHQAPASQTPTRPQSARIHAINTPSPPPAHQASVTPTHHMYPSHIEEFQARQLAIQKVDVDGPRVTGKKSKPVNKARIERQQNKRQCKTTSLTEDDIVTTAHAIYHPNQMVGETQIVYQPSTETYASEQVLYQPQTDVFTKEQIVYQPRKNMFAKTQVVYQPRRDFIATAEAVYQSDKVTARQTVIQSQTGTMETAEAVYNTQDNIMPEENNVHDTQADILRATEALYRQQAARQITAQIAQGTRRSQRHFLAETQTAHHRHVSSRDTTVVAERHGTTPILRNILTNEHEHAPGSQEEANNIAMLQFLLANYNTLQNTSSTGTLNQNPRQTRKRNSSTQSAPVPAETTFLSPDIQSLVALNWTLQSLPSSNQVTPHYIELLKALITNNNNTMDVAKYGDRS